MSLFQSWGQLESGRNVRFRIFGTPAPKISPRTPHSKIRKCPEFIYTSPPPRRPYTTHAIAPPGTGPISRRFQLSCPPPVRPSVRPYTTHAIAPLEVVM